MGRTDGRIPTTTDVTIASIATIAFASAFISTLSYVASGAARSNEYHGFSHEHYSTAVTATVAVASS